MLREIGRAVGDKTRMQLLSLLQDRERTAVEEGKVGSREHETSRAQFVGRGRTLEALDRLTVEELMDRRYSKYRDIRFFAE